MSPRIGARLARNNAHLPLSRRYLHHPAFTTGGIRPAGVPSTLRHTRQLRDPYGVNRIHNLPAIRSVSFVRSIPSLAIKLVRLPALLGAATISGLAYVQYQAGQAATYASDVFRQGRDMATKGAGEVFGGAKSFADRMGNGWEKTKEDLEMPTWLQELFQKGESGNGGGGPPPGGPGPKVRSSAGGAAAAGTGAAFGYSQSDEEDERSNQQVARDDQMMVLTKKMIEIRSILQQVGQSDTLVLPSIVVIGSQSSGKSSVLEAVVGHEFLPKGSNMITRRPIELTLVNTPEAQAEYGEFPALQLGKITDFSQIQRTLTDLNLAVPAEQCVSDDPIQLRISSPNVPDLSLIDLPGYIQISGLDQPTELKQKIADLCDKYIQPPNVILAISAADVDLANSTALRASRRVDPRGERTIGVITKMDLVEAERGASMLADQKYPLRLGYVGVVSRVPQQTGLFSRGSGNITSAITKNENNYFSSHPLEFGPESSLALGTTTLRKKLMHVLEQTMAASLSSTSEAIHQELEEATYEFKVQYNDRPLSAESYLAESLDAFKHSYKAFAESFGRPQVRELLKEELDQRVLDLLAQRYWNKPITDLNPPLPDPEPLSDLPKAALDSPYWHRKLDASSSALTKLGIGRIATTVVANALQEHVDRLIDSSTFASHPFARKAITEASQGILRDQFPSTSDQVENCIKPYKFEFEVEDAEWAQGRQNVAQVMKKELKACEGAIKQAEENVGGKRKMKDVMSFIERVRKGEVVLEGNGRGGAGGYSADLLAKGRESLFLTHRSALLTLRLSALKSRPCTTSPSTLPASPSSPNKTPNPPPNQSYQKYACPEILLDALSTKLVSTAVLFLNVELLSEFNYHFPRELDKRLGKNLEPELAERFAREDRKVAGHLDVIRRKELLEVVLGKMEGLRGLEGEKGREMERERGYTGGGGSGGKGKERKGWLF